MKNKSVFKLLLALGLILVLGAGSSLAQEATVAGPAGADAAVGTAFTYQGLLIQGANPVAGLCDFQFSLWDAASGGAQVGSTQSQANVALANGAFDAPLDFGAAAFQGESRYLQIAVRCPAGSGAYTTLSGRVALTAAPYALSLRPGASIQSTGSALNLSSSAASGFALTVVATGTTAIYGQGGAATGAGVAGFNTNGATTASGVSGINGGYGMGVFGQTASGHGVHGKATNLAEGYGVYSEGNTYVDGELSWKGKTGYVSVPAAAFVPASHSNMYTNWGNVLYPANMTSRYYYAAVQLPHGAVVTRVMFGWSDVSGDYKGVCYLYRSNMTGGGDTLATVETTGQAGVGSSNTATIANATVNNAQYTYYVGWDLQGAGDVQGYGVVIEYTFYEPY